MTKNVLEWLENTANRVPEKIAYRSTEKDISFTEVLNGSKIIGSAICKLDVEDRPIAVVMRKKVQTIQTFLGVAYSGHAYAPIDATLPNERIEVILNSLNPALIITDVEDEKKVRDIVAASNVNDDKVVMCNQLTSQEINEEALTKVRMRMIEQMPLYIIYTSGSSGVPKGVITSHHSLMCYIESYCDVMQMSEEDVIGNQSPLDYIAAIRDIYIPLYKGATTALTPKEYFMQPEKLFAYLNENHITSLGWSTSALTVLTSLNCFEENKLETVQKICFSGSVMSPVVLRKWQEHLPNARFVNQYGPTEATASCTYYVVDHMVDEAEEIPIGQPYNNYYIYLITDDNRLAEAGEEGEICVAGPALALGYYNNLERTLKDFVQNPLHESYMEKIYRTGDLGVMQNGNLMYRGRRDRQIKHMGHRVELDEIEIAAMRCENVKECSVLYNKSKETLCMFYVGEANKRDLSIQLRAILPGFMIPRSITQMDELPKLPNGKINMKELEKGMM